MLLPLTTRQIAERIAKDRSKWLTKQFKKILPNRLFCIVRNQDDARMHEVEKYLEEAGVKIDVSPLTCSISMKGRLMGTWQAKVNIAEPKVIPVQNQVIITDAVLPHPVPNGGEKKRLIV